MMRRCHKRIPWPVVFLEGVQFLEPCISLTEDLEDIFYRKMFFVLHPVLGWPLARCYGRHVLLQIIHVNNNLHTNLISLVNNNLPAIVINRTTWIQEGLQKEWKIYNDFQDEFRHCLTVTAVRTSGWDQLLLTVWQSLPLLMWLRSLEVDRVRNEILWALQGRSYANEPVYVCNRDALYMIKHDGVCVSVRCLQFGNSE